MRYMQINGGAIFLFSLGKTRILVESSLGKTHNIVESSLGKTR